MGCGAGILGTLLVLVGVVLHALISTFIYRVFISARFGDEVACALLTLTYTGFAVSFVLYEVIFIVWQVRTSQRVTDKSSCIDGGKKPLDKIVLWVMIGCILLSLIFSVFAANTFTELREDSISKVCFVATKEYRWDNRCDVLRYTLTCDQSGALNFSITMKDGEVIELLGTSYSHSDTFAEMYRTSEVDLLSYIADLTDAFDSSDYIIERSVNSVTIENAKTIYSNDENRALIWEQIQRIIE